MLPGRCEHSAWVLCMSLWNTMMGTGTGWVDASFHRMGFVTEKEKNNKKV